MKKLLCLILALAMLSGCARLGGDTQQSSRPTLMKEFSEQICTFSFQPEPSEVLTLSAEGAQRAWDVISQQTADYQWSHLYDLEEVKSRLDFDASVESHAYCVLDETGSLNASHLCQLVLKNNEQFLADKPFGYRAVEEDYVQQICDFIVMVVDAMKEKYPQLDWQRVYCNLGNLKILYDVGMLSFAQVSQEMILSISQNNTQTILNLKGEDGFSRVMTHEIMHILQIGCVCEQIENCGRRAGIAVYWDDFTLNTTDWSWLAEGSAERQMCMLTGWDAVTYQYKMDYICSMTMTILLRDTVAADTLDTLCFYDDPQLLFDAFGCQTQEQKDELLNMMITLQVLQMQPNNFHILYAEETGVNLKEDSDAMDQFSYSLKPAICVSLAREFYENLLPVLQQGQLTYGDLFFLINLFEGHLNPHLNYTNEAKDQINQPFLTAYRTMRRALFDALEAEHPGVDLMALYEAYDITAMGENLLNGQLSMLPQTKLDFLAERAQWQAERNGLGCKIPA